MVGKCPRCIRGNTFIDFVEGQWREYCLQCGYSRAVSESDPRIPKDPKIRSACEVGKGIPSRKNLPGVMPREKGARNIVITGSGFKLNGDK